ncbi:MAG: hypothetical protein M1825_005464 [Sarcosagium campestre]|nr:MAG: hypothetical protein M1825_005464 [Sarcosagium campestre]
MSRPQARQPTAQVKKKPQDATLTRYGLVALRMTTAPWYSLSLAIEQILKVEDEHRRLKLLDRWRENKKTEFNFVSLAGTVVGSAVTGSIQWSQLATAHWFVLAVWYGSLVLSLFCVVIAFHLSILIANSDSQLRGPAVFADLLKARSTGRARPGVLFILQVPVMLLSYAIISYLVGLGVLVMYPLRLAWADESKIAVVGILYFVFASAVYAVVSFLIYNDYLPVIANDTL